MMFNVENKGNSHVTSSIKRSLFRKCCPPPPVALNVNASSNPAYSQRLSTDTLQRSGNGISEAQKVFETALYAREHNNGTLGYLVKTEHKIQTLVNELTYWETQLQNLNVSNEGRVKQMTATNIRGTIEPAINKTKSAIKIEEEKKDTGLFNFGRDLQKFKTRQGDIAPDHLAKHKEFEEKTAFRADGNYPTDRKKTVSDKQAFWRELGNHYLKEILENPDSEKLERFNYTD